MQRSLATLVFAVSLSFSASALAALPSTGSAVLDWLDDGPLPGQSINQRAEHWYRAALQFERNGYRATSATLSGRLPFDNSTTLLLNGEKIGTGAGTGASFVEWSHLQATGGFRTDVNTVDELMRENVESLAGHRWTSNGDDDIALQLQGGITAAVPEPQTYAMWLAGAGIVALFGRRRRA